MKRELKPIDYVTKDYEGFRNLMIELIPKYAPEWTDTSQSDFGIVLIELLANGLDILSYYQDKSFQEAFLTTAKTRRAIINLCRTLGYELSHQTPAIHKVQFTKKDEFLNDIIVIPRGTKVCTDSSMGSPVVFELEEDVVLKSGEKSNFGTVVHGEYVQDEVLGISDGKDFQKFNILFPDVLVDSLNVYTNEYGKLKKWKLVSDFLNSKSDSRHYTITTDEENIMTINFGNGLSGMIPPKGYTIMCEYRYGGGEIGNVGLGTINTFLETEYPGVELSNIEILSRGYDVESIDHAKLVAPKYFRSANRAVTKRDFEDIVSTLEGVEKAKCVETFNENNEVHIYVLTTGYEPITENHKNKILKHLKDVKLSNVNPVIFPTEFTEYDIDLEVITYSNYSNSEVSARVIEALQHTFDVKYMEYGEDVYVNSIVREVMKIEGVRNVIVNNPMEDILVDEISIAKINEISVITTGGED